MGEDERTKPIVLGLVAWKRAYAEPRVWNSSARARPFFSAGVISPDASEGSCIMQKLRWAAVKVSVSLAIVKAGE